MSTLETLQGNLGYVFRDPALLRLALTHPSVTHESPSLTAHNQRLEFLGDAVLGLILTRELYVKFPSSGEGELTKARAHLVNRQSLAELAGRLNLGEHLILSRGEEASGGRRRPSALADAFEAILGAIFLDGGYDKAQAFVLAFFQEAFGELKEIPNMKNPKGELQEWLQARSSVPPTYEMTAVDGPDHDRVFECVVLHQGQVLGRGRGKSKKEAESQAAYEALLVLRQT